MCPLPGPAAPMVILLDVCRDLQPLPQRSHAGVVQLHGPPVPAEVPFEVQVDVHSALARPGWLDLAAPSALTCPG